MPMQRPSSITTKIEQATLKLLKSIHYLKTTTTTSATHSQKHTYLTQCFDELLATIYNNNNAQSYTETLKLLPIHNNSNILSANIDLIEYQYTDVTSNYLTPLTCSVIFHRVHGVLKVMTNNSFLNLMCMNYVINVEVGKQIESLEEYLMLYRDVNERKCDKCGMYFKISVGEIPIIRKIELDYVAAYHESCL